MGVRCIKFVAIFQSMDFSDNLCEINFKTIRNREVWKDGWIVTVEACGESIPGYASVDVNFNWHF